MSIFAWRPSKSDDEYDPFSDLPEDPSAEPSPIHWYIEPPNPAAGQRIIDEKESTPSW
jgi:hypothetical protein